MPVNKTIKKSGNTSSSRVQNMTAKVEQRLDEIQQKEIEDIAKRRAESRVNIDDKLKESEERYDNETLNAKRRKEQNSVSETEPIQTTENKLNGQATDVAEREVTQMPKFQSKDMDLLGNENDTVVDVPKAGDGEQELKGIDVEKVDVNVNIPNIDGNGDLPIDDEETEQTPLKGDDQENKKKEKKESVSNETLRDTILAQKDKNKELYEQAQDVVPILFNNIFVKQFFTGNSFGNGFVMKAHKDTVDKDKDKNKENKKDENISYEAEYVVENLKPGRPKSVVISVPEMIATFLSEMGSATTENAIMDFAQRISDDNGKIDRNGEWTKNLVDFDMTYSDFMTRVTTLMGGAVLEYGGVGGELDYTGEKYNCKRVRGDDTKLDTDKVEISPTYVTIRGKRYIQYEVSSSFDPAVYVEAIKTGKALEEKDNNARYRWMNGNVPLVRSGKAFSQLFTPKNFTPLAKYDDVPAFVSTLTKEDAERLSARAKYWYDEKYLKDRNKYYMQSYSDGMFKDGSNIAEVFNPSIKPEDRFRILTYAEGVTLKDGQGNPRTVLTDKKDANGNTVKDEKGKPVKVAVPRKSGNMYLTKRIPRDHYTGKQITAENMGEVRFVRYGETGLTKDQKITSPRALIYKYKDPQSTTDDAANVVGTFDVSDEIFAHAKSLMSEETILAAITRSKEVARKDNSRSKVGKIENVLLGMSQLITVSAPVKKDSKETKK